MIYQIAATRIGPRPSVWTVVLAVLAAIAILVN
jgi:hypothetical protein